MNLTFKVLVASAVVGLALTSCATAEPSGTTQADPPPHNSQYVILDSQAGDMDVWAICDTRRGNLIYYVRRSTNSGGPAVVVGGCASGR